MSTPEIPPSLTLETALAASLGVPRDTLVENRKKMLLGEDWLRHGNAIAYTEAGLQKMTAALALQSPLEGAPAAPSAGVRTLFVKRLARRNGRIVFASEKKGEGEELAVRVRDASLFVPGQEIQVRDDGDGLHLHGHQPRRRGRA